MPPMIHIIARLFVVGNQFSPAEAETMAGFRFTQKSERGVLGTTGRYKGQPLPHGSAELEATAPGHFLTTADGPFFEAAEALTRAAQAQGEVDVRLHADVKHDGQCNLEIAPCVLAALHRLGVPLTMTCYETGKNE
jgi:hypothetical protein